MYIVHSRNIKVTAEFTALSEAVAAKMVVSIGRAASV